MQVGADENAEAVGFVRARLGCTLNALRTRHLYPSSLFSSRFSLQVNTLIFRVILLCAAHYATILLSTTFSSFIFLKRPNKVQ
jgi:hypothetical protein